MQAFIALGLAAVGLVAGASALLQQVLVANLRTALGSPYWAVLISYIGGTLTMIAVMAAIREPMIAAGAIARSSYLTWAAGVFGVIYIVLTILLIPRLGAATVLALLIAGQLLSAIAFDHFGLFGLERHPIDIGRMAGAALLIGGVLLIRN
jgi:transporter family-2 protein